MKITKAFEWHIEGEIIDENPQALKIDPTYVARMKQDIIDEREKINGKRSTRKD